MTTKAQQNADRIAANKLIAYATKVRRLTGQLVGHRLGDNEINEAYAEGKEAEAFAAEIAAREPVGKAVWPLKAKAVEAAADKARNTVERVRKDMAEADGDLNTAAPYMRGSAWDHKTQLANSRRSLFSTLTKEDQTRISAWHDAAPADQEARVAYFRAGRPEWRTMSQRGIDHFVARAEAQAAAEYDSFVCKLVAKVGDVVDAELTGDHVWSYSVLRVTKAKSHCDTGVQTFVERWKTQQIWNVSVLGLHFPQWPTRLMKG